MSASEKLKALEREQALEGRFPHWETDGDLLKALPQLLAVVEAAERLLDDRHVRDLRLASSLTARAALSALEEALA